MSMRGSCKCRNIEVWWRTVDYSAVPRQCLCEYCREKSVCYVSKAGTRVDVTIRDARLHKTVRQGSNTAVFHECGNCGVLVLVTADIDGEVYGALNANCLDNPLGFCAAVEMDFSAQAAGDKMDRWKANWCRPVCIAQRAPGVS